MAQWSFEELDYLSRLKRERVLVKGIIRHVNTRNIKTIDEAGKPVVKQVEYAQLVWSNGESTFEAYCTEDEFSSHKYRSIAGFVGTYQTFIVDDINIEAEAIVTSIKKADDMRAKTFIEELETLEKGHTLQEKVYKGVLYGYNPQTNNIFVRVEGMNTFMMRNDWDYGRVGALETLIERGETIDVKVVRFSKENNQVQVSRKATFQDPFEKLVTLQEFDRIAGKVTRVDPIHGIFVMLDIGLEVKATRPRKLEEPIVGEMVACVLKNFDVKKRTARVVITAYPQGKKSRRDVASFLFD